MSDKIPTPIVDINGKRTTVHKRTGNSKKARARVANLGFTVYYPDPKEVDKEFANNILTNLGFSKSAVRDLFDTEHDGFLLDGLHNQLWSVRQQSLISDFDRGSKETYEAAVINAIATDVKPLMDRMDELDIPRNRQLKHLYVAFSTIPRTELLKDYPIELAEKSIDASATGLVQLRKGGFDFETLAKTEGFGVDHSIITDVLNGKPQEEHSIIGDILNGQWDR